MGFFKNLETAMLQQKITSDAEYSAFYERINQLSCKLAYYDKNSPQVKSIVQDIAKIWPKNFNQVLNSHQFKCNNGLDFVLMMRDNELSLRGLGYVC